MTSYAIIDILIIVSIVVAALIFIRNYDGLKDRLTGGRNKSVGTKTAVCADCGRMYDGSITGVYDQCGKDCPGTGSP